MFKTSGAVENKLHKFFCYEGGTRGNSLGGRGQNNDVLHEETQETFMDHKVIREVVVSNISLL